MCWRYLGLVRISCLVVASGSPVTSAVAEDSASTVPVYVGTYTGGESDGIYLLHLNQATGELSSKGLAAESVNPSFLAIHPSGRYLYAVNEIGDYEGQSAGAVSAFAIDSESDKLKLLNQQSSGGSDPCHLVVDRAGRHVLVANYGGGSVAVRRIEADGSLGKQTAFIQHEGSSVNPNRQQAPHAHSINLDRANRFAFAADLGIDRVLVYRFDAGDGSLHPSSAAEVKPGAGPRHFALHPTMRFAYVINELDSTITAFAYQEEPGRLSPLQSVSALPPNFDGESHTAEVQVSADGKFAFGSNRGHDSIAVFSIDDASGKLTHVQTQSTRGKTPRNFGLDPTGKFLLAANQSTNNIVVFRIDSQRGQLQPTGYEVTIPSPVCVKFLEAAR